MTTWIALLRGINVGGANKVAMADLRAIVASLGHTDVVTHIQSGNVIFEASARDQGRLASALADAIERELGLRLTVVMRTVPELQACLAANPFPEVTELSRVLVTFLSAVPQGAAAAKLEPERFLPDRFQLHGTEMYAYYPNGAGRSKLNLDYFEKRLGVRGTARNLNTVAKLIELAV
jgi:uncharacterized protein (DUF1697 family)